MSQAWSLPTCSGSPSYDESTYWDNCIGTYTWANGNKYVGEWKDSKQDGEGTMTYADGRVLKGLWENRRFIGKE